MESYILELGYYYDDVSVYIVLEYDTSIEKVKEIVEGDIALKLLKDNLQLYINDKERVIGSKDNSVFKILLCNKNMPKPVDVSNMTDSEKLNLLSDEAYKLTSDDYSEVNWTLVELYKYLKEYRPSKEEFIFSSLNYSVKKKTGDGRLENIELYPCTCGAFKRCCGGRNCHF